MKELEPTEAAKAWTDWTTEQVEAAACPYYPLSESGPLCPLLDNENLLYEFYVTGNLRRDIKRFCKTHRWEGRPQYPYAMTDEALKKLLRSLWNSPSARRTLQASGDRLLLHNAIWRWLANVNQALFDTANSHAHQNTEGAVFMTPTELGAFLDTPDGDDVIRVREQKTYVGIAFAMLEIESRAALVTQLIRRYPEAALGLGLPAQLPQTQEQARPGPVQREDDNFVPPVEPTPPPAAASATLHVPPAPLDCWVSHVDNFIAKAEALRETSERFAKQATELSGVETLFAFADSGAVRDMLVSLDSSREQVMAQSEQVLRLLKSPCANAAEPWCELQRFVEQSHAKPPETITGLTIAARTMREKTDGLVSRAQSARKELRLLKPEAAELSRLLQLPDPSPDVPAETASPCKILDAVSNQRRIISELRQRVATETMRRKDLMVANAETIRKQYDLGSGASFKDCLALYIDLRNRISSTEDIEDVQECELLLEDLMTKCRAAEQFDHRKLAGRLQKEPEAFSVFLDLCQTLTDQGSPEIAYLLLHVRQRVHQFEEIAVMPDRSLDLLLETACAAAANQLPVSTAWESLCTQPWLLSIENNDIQSPDLLERIVVALIGAALGSQAEQASSMLARLGGRGFSRQQFSEPLEAVLQAVLAHKSVRIAMPEQLAHNREREESLRESLSFEGGKYRHLQCGKAHHYARFETVHVFPALAALWQDISSAVLARRFDVACGRVANLDADEWYNDLVRRSDRVIAEHPHFSGKIRAFMSSFVTRLQAYVEESQATWGGDDGELVIARTAFIETLHQWAGNQKARTAVVELVARTLALDTATTSRSVPFWRAISLCPNVLLRCPHFVTWLRSQQDPAPDSHLEQTLLADLTVEHSTAESVLVLESDAAWEHLCAVPKSDELIPAPEWQEKLQRDLSELASHRSDVQAVKDGRLLALYDACVEGGRFHAARQLLQQCGQRKAEERAEQKQRVSSFAKERLKALDTVKERASAANMPSHWLESVGAFAARLEMQIRLLKRADDPQEATAVTQARLAKAVEALDFLVEQNSSVFDEVEHLLISQLPKPPSGVSTSADKDRARSKCPDLHATWDSLARTDDPDEDNARRQWAQFARGFCKACNLYHGEHDDQHRFTTVPSIKYPFPVLQTAFHKPQSEFLKRPLRLYLYRQRDVDLQALQRLETELSSEAAADWLHVVFAPQGFERIQRYFKYDTGFKDFLLVDEEFLYRVTFAEKHDVPVRQALHASVKDLGSSSPFVAQGYCHQSNNIYVGRKEVLRKLLNTPQAMIWGGRRIGKTSILHALENSLRHPSRNYRVAYVYVDIEDAGNPDVAIAQKICAALALPPAETISEFEKQATALRASGTRLAFLIDEVDEYIKKSRAVHGDAFPLATALRQLVMDDAAGDTRLVYSGYHQLYHEARLRAGPRRVGHPFINTAQCVPVGNLTLDDVKELITTGFEDMLGVHLAPEVPSLIFRRASGHPAFVQQFCRCLVGWVQNRRSPGVPFTIRASDVEAVYTATAEWEEQTFIFYVNETLGYNLSHLGRAIMIALCDLIRPQKDGRADDRSFSLKEVHNEIVGWCDVARLSPPEPTHLTQTVDLLVMTNMLTQDPTEQDRYQVTYPAYIDILQRLGQLGRAQIEHSLAMYDAKERQNGVIL